jgi:hypothetical protein
MNHLMDMCERLPADESIKSRVLYRNNICVPRLRVKGYLQMKVLKVEYCTVITFVFPDCISVCICLHLHLVVFGHPSCAVIFGHLLYLCGFYLSRPALWPTQPPVQWVPGVLSLGLKHGWGMTLTIHPRVVPRSRISRSCTSSLPKHLHGV